MAGASTRHLLIMRHAKAQTAAATDHERSLADSGRLDAAAAGAWLADHGFTPDLALVSDATRTQQTYAELAAGSGLDVEATLEPGLYDAGPDTALDIVKEAAGEARSVLVVGHNPTMGMLAHGLSDGEGPAEPDMVNGFPTAAIAVLTWDGDWADLGPQTCSVVEFQVARG